LLNTSAKMAQVYKLGTELLEEHGLTDWRFDLSNHKTLVGQCDHRKKLIQYSVHYTIKTPMHTIKDTILHEIAHALVGPNHGHDWTWKRKCIEIGAKPERLVWEATTATKPNYILECPECGQRWKRYRLKRNIRYGARCPYCNVALKIYKVVKK
jgi:predicted SprT family Zn-dependent metalloprotease